MYYRVNQFINNLEALCAAFLINLVLSFSVPRCHYSRDSATPKELWIFGN